MSWYLVGHVAGLGIRKAVTSAAHSSSVRQALNPAGAVVVTPMLDIDRVITDRFFFQFGVPWGWRDLRRYEADQALALLGIPVVSGVIAERTDENQTYFLVSPFPMEGEGIASVIMQAAEVHRLRFNKALNGRPLGVPVKIMIGGELGLIYHYIGDVDGAFKGQSNRPTVSVTTTECLFTRHGQGFLVTFITGSEYHERYLPCLWTMFGSWRWLR